MFESAKLAGTPRKGIVLQTRKGRPIVNEQAGAPDAQHISEDARNRAEHIRWEPRKPLCGIYNCYGHIWASRRTAIYDVDELEKIRQDDGYRELGQGEAPAHGDIVVYRLVTGTISHVGVVSELRQLLGGASMESPREPWILSKWSDHSCECLHHVNDVVLPTNLYSFTFWTDRPRLPNART